MNKLSVILIVISIAIAGTAFFYLQGRSFPAKQGAPIGIITEAPIEAPVEMPIEEPTQISPQPVIQPPVSQPVDESNKLPGNAEVAEFIDWAKNRGITLQAVTAGVDDMYYNRYEPDKHNIALGQIPGLMLAYQGLRMVTGGALLTMKNKTIYFSTSNERPYTNLTGDYFGTLKNTKPGFILTQPLSAMSTVHELGHIVGYHGIEGIYGFDAIFSYLKEDYDSLFNTAGISYPPESLPKGYISTYATANKAENFAEHFAYYIVDPENFKNKMSGDDLLIPKYNFFKNSKMFQLPTTSETVGEKCRSNQSPVFTNHITDISKINYIVPPPTMGAGPNLKTHSYIGTDHALVPVYVPTAATLKSGSHYIGGPYMIEFQVSCEVRIRFGHITNPLDVIKNLLPKEPQSDSRTQELNPISFAAGELVGYTTGTSMAGNWDYGVYNSAASNRYANDPDWNNSSVYTTAVCPFDYFAPDLKSAYDAKYNSYALGGNPPHGESFCK